MADTVYGEGVTAVIAAKTGNPILTRTGVVAIKANARIDPDDIANVSVKCRGIFEHLTCKTLTWTNRQLGDANARASNNDFTAS